MKYVAFPLALCGLLAYAPAHASPEWGPPTPGKIATCGKGGPIDERVSPGFKSTFEVFATDCSGTGKIIPGSSQVKADVGSVHFDVPGTIDGQKVGDFVNRNTENVHVPKSFAASAAMAIEPGAVSVLNGESLFQDPLSGLWELEDAFAQFQFRVGSHHDLRIPDLYADTNGDGIIGAGDVLYSWVDLRTYPDVEPTYALGDFFSIVNGKVDGLPGMWFSPTEIFLDPVLGPQPSGGSWFDSGQAFGVVTEAASGGAVALTEHDLVSSVPEPSAWLLMAGGGVALLWTRRRRAHD